MWANAIIKLLFYSSMVIVNHFCHDIQDHIHCVQLCTIISAPLFKYSTANLRLIIVM